MFALPGGTYFVDQYGDVFTGPSGSGNRVANAVTDMAVRSALASYLAALAHAIPAGLLSAVRAGGGPYGELRYPSSSYAGHTDCWWAYDQSTQATSPVPGWRPGTGSVARATAFLNSYNANLTQFAAWQDSTYSSDFRVPVLLLMPGWGQRPGVAAEVESSLLTKSYPEFNQGLDWPAELAALPDKASTIAYTTYLDAPSFPGNEDPANYLASLAAPYGMRLGRRTPVVAPWPRSHSRCSEPVRSATWCSTGWTKDRLSPRAPARTPRARRGLTSPGRSAKGPAPPSPAPPSPAQPSPATGRPWKGPDGP